MHAWTVCYLLLLRSSCVLLYSSLLPAMKFLGCICADGFRHLHCCVLCPGMIAPRLCFCQGTLACFQLFFCFFVFFANYKPCAAMDILVPAFCVSSWMGRACLKRVPPATKIYGGGVHTLSVTAGQFSRVVMPAPAPTDRDESPHCSTFVPTLI